MNIFETHLYYPYISVPKRALIHSLLFQDGLQRIIPSFMASKEDDLFDKFCVENLGRKFIQNGSFFQASDDISEIFCSFLKSAHNAKKPDMFEVLLGEDYQTNLRVDPSSVNFQQPIVFAEKMSPEVIETLKYLGWAKISSGRSKYPLTCEMREELCLLFMAVLACSMSKVNGVPISTENRRSEDLVRTKEFQSFFKEFLPTSSSTEGLENFSLTLLIGRDDDPTQPSLVDLLTIEEAVRIRGGVENERVAFGKIVQRLVTKAKACNDVTSFLKEEAREVVEHAEDYKRSVEKNVIAALDKQRANDKALMKWTLRTGFSVLIPVVEKVVASQISVPGLGATVATAILNYMTGKPEVAVSDEPQEVLSDREKAYLFMNRMWDQIEKRS